MRYDLKDVVDKCYKKNDLEGLQDLCKRFPKNPGLHMSLAYLAKKMYKYDIALGALAVVIGVNDSNYINQARLEVAKIFKYKKMYDKAEKVLKGIIETSVNSEAIKELALIYIERKEYDKALEVINLLNSSFFAKEYNEIMGLYYYYVGELESAKTFLEHSKGSPKMTIRLGIINMQLKNYEEALKLFRSVTQPWYKETVGLLQSEVYLRSKKPNEALKITLSIVNSSHSCASLYQVATIYHRLRQYSDAAINYKEVYVAMNSNAGLNDGFHIERERIVYLLIISLIKSAQYKEAISIMLENNLVGNTYGYYFKLYSFCCRMGNITPEYQVDDFSKSYSGFLASNYSKQAAVKHINRRHTEEREKHGSVLNVDNIEELYNFARGELKPERRVDTLSFEDVYAINYPNIGLEGEDQLLVVTNPNTDEIITLYPEFSRDNISLKIIDDEDNQLPFNDNNIDDLAIASEEGLGRILVSDDN